jgi:hypothetical protein
MEIAMETLLFLLSLKQADIMLPFLFSPINKHSILCFVTRKTDLPQRVYLIFIFIQRRLSCALCKKQYSSLMCSYKIIKLATKQYSGLMCSYRIIKLATKQYSGLRCSYKIIKLATKQYSGLMCSYRIIKLATKQYSGLRCSYKITKLQTAILFCC